MNGPLVVAQPGVDIVEAARVQVSPRVVGLDLSLTATGMALAGGVTVTIKPTAKGDWRLTQIRGTVRDALEACQLAPAADLVVIEDLPTHAHAAGITGMVHGAVRTLLHDWLPYVTVPPALLKKYATGKGNSDKTAMALAAFKRAGIEFADNDQCDAAWLRWMGLDAIGFPAFDLPAVNREALAKVEWPKLPRLTPVGEAR